MIENFSLDRVFLPRAYFFKCFAFGSLLTLGVNMLPPRLILVSPCVDSTEPVASLMLDMEGVSYSCLLYTLYKRPDMFFFLIFGGELLLLDSGFALSGDFDLAVSSTTTGLDEAINLASGKISETLGTRGFFEPFDDICS